jgi:ABC-type nickel/cobalt efflux system permease component RcnA
MNITSLYFSAFLIGVTHAIEPGHGKTFIVGALINSKRKWVDPLYMGISTAAGHTLGVVLFSQLSFYLAHSFLEGRIRPIFEAVIGLSLVMIGAVTIYKVMNAASSLKCSASCCGPKGKSDISEKSNQQRSFSSVCFLIGLIPCPTAIALATTSVGIESSMEVFIVAGIFGCGVATTLAIIGLLFTHATETLNGTKLGIFGFRWIRFVEPVIFITLGVWLLVHVLFNHVQHA